MSDVMWSNKVREKRAITGYVAAVTHLHQEVQERHIHASKKSVNLAMSCLIQIAVIPQPVLRIRKPEGLWME